MNKDEASKWLENEIMKLTPSCYRRTYYTVATIDYLPIGRRVVQDSRQVVIPVDVYENYDLGFEIIGVVSLAGQIPWDLKDTIVKIDTNHTHIDGRVEELIMESLPAHKKLAELDNAK